MRYLCIRNQRYFVLFGCKARNTNYILILKRNKIYRWSPNLVYNCNLSLLLEILWKYIDALEWFKRNHQINDTYLRFKIYSIYGINQRYFALFVCRTRNTKLLCIICCIYCDAMWTLKFATNAKIHYYEKINEKNIYDGLQMTLITYICFQDIFCSWQK